MNTPKRTPKARIERAVEQITKAAGTLRQVQTDATDQADDTARTIEALTVKEQGLRDDAARAGRVAERLDALTA